MEEVERISRKFVDIMELTDHMPSEIMLQNIKANETKYAVWKVKETGHYVSNCTLWKSKRLVKGNFVVVLNRDTWYIPEDSLRGFLQKKKVYSLKRKRYVDRSA
jgi:hypothetical protein